jgi:peptidoglycan/xylan/chitin deacetylase (PgdA/CDA1 family)
LVLLPILSADAGWGDAFLIAGAILVATAMALGSRAVGQGSSLRFVGAALVIASAILIGVTPVGLIGLLIAAVLGAAIGLLLDHDHGGVKDLPAGLVLALVLVTTANLAGRVDALRLAAAAVTVIAAVPRRRHTPSSRPSIAIAGGAVILGIGLLGFVGASDVGVRWFGPAVAHGSRHNPRVALTFDDGPDGTFTLQVAAILERYGVRGTFFEVGKAVDSDPQTARALLARGHLLANHSYEHDGWRWLDPRYPELERAQRSFVRQVGVCPTFYRPPHGERTPFLSATVRRHGMTTVLWDVSAGDWNATNADTVARVVLKQARPGSIIVLHDGLDGNPGADRSIVVAALPKILEGLKIEGLQPVRLDVLLGVAGYSDHC